VNHALDPGTIVISAPSSPAVIDSATATVHPRAVNATPIAPDRVSPSVP
jgi:hypothetical protein